MLGRKVTRADGTVFTITGVSHEGTFVLAPEIFGSPITVSVVDLISDYDVTLDAVALPPSEFEVVNGLRDEPPAPVAPAKPHTPPPGSPEAHFAAVAEEDR